MIFCSGQSGRPGGPRTSSTPARARLVVGHADCSLSDRESIELVCRNPFLDAWRGGDCRPRAGRRGRTPHRWSSGTAVEGVRCVGRDERARRCLWRLQRPHYIACFGSLLRAWQGTVECRPSAVRPRRRRSGCPSGMLRRFAARRCVALGEWPTPFSVKLTSRRVADVRAGADCTRGGLRTDRSVLDRLGSSGTRRCAP